MNKPQKQKLLTDAGRAYVAGVMRSKWITMQKPKVDVANAQRQHIAGKTPRVGDYVYFNKTLKAYNGSPAFDIPSGSVGEVKTVGPEGWLLTIELADGTIVNVTRPSFGAFSLKRSSQMKPSHQGRKWQRAIRRALRKTKPTRRTLARGDVLYVASQLPPQDKTLTPGARYIIASVTPNPHGAGLPSLIVLKPLLGGQQVTITDDRIADGPGNVSSMKPLLHETRR